MNVRKTAREIGLFEAGINLARVLDSEDALARGGASMPLPDRDIAGCVPQIAAWLRGFGKRKYLFLTPEIALMEELAKLGDPQEEVILVIPHDLEADAKERIRNNLPRGIRVTALEEPDFPQSVFPSDSLMVVCGYSACGRPMVLPDTYRMLEHYSGFLGRKVFLPYRELDTAARYDGWMEVCQNRLSTEWRRSL